MKKLDLFLCTVTHFPVFIILHDLVHMYAVVTGTSSSMPAMGGTAQGRFYSVGQSFGS